MNFKENAIKPGMIIHCPKEENARALLEYLDGLGYTWSHGGDLMKNTHYKVYESGTCYNIDLSGKTITYGDLYADGRPSCEKPPTEFSDLIESEPRFKVGDKVRARNGIEAETVPFIDALLKDEGKVLTIISVISTSDGYVYSTKESAYNWSEKLLEPALEPVDDSPINSDTDSPMTAKELLKWLRKHRYDKVIERVLGYGYIENNFYNLTDDEIIQRITTYEAAKKASKPVDDSSTNSNTDSPTRPLDMPVYATNISEEFYLSDSDTEPIGGEWSKICDKAEGKYLWSRYTVVYSDGEFCTCTPFYRGYSMDVVPDAEPEEMSAEEALDWLWENVQKKGVLYSVFEQDCDMQSIFVKYTPEEIIQKIEQYEAAKKAPKPVKVEYGWKCEIFRGEGDYVTVLDKKEIWEGDKTTAMDEAAERARQYVVENGEQVYFRVCGICRVKKGES